MNMKPKVISLLQKPKSVNNKLKFKFIFEDASVAIQEADSFSDAAILVTANRIRSNKSKKLIGAWNKTTNGEWENVVQKRVEVMI